MQAVNEKHSCIQIESNFVLGGKHHEEEEMDDGDDRDARTGSALVCKRRGQSKSGARPSTKCRYGLEGNSQSPRQHSAGAARQGALRDRDAIGAQSGMLSGTLRISFK